MSEKSDYLKEAVRHLDVSRYNVVPLIQAMRCSALSARDLARAADIYDSMLCDHDCLIVLCLAGSLVSAGLKKVFADAVQLNMADAIVAAEPAVIEQDFFEALDFRHYAAADCVKTGTEDQTLRQLHVGRIHDTLIDEDQLRICGETLQKIAAEMPPGVCSSRQFIRQVGQYLDRQETKPVDSILYEAYKAGVPIFCPAGSGQGSGLSAAKCQLPSLSPAKDSDELVRLLAAAPRMGLIMIGSVPEVFAQGVARADDGLGAGVPLPTYAIRIGGTSSPMSALRVETCQEQTVDVEATLAVPLVFGYAYHLAHWLGRSRRNYSQLLDGERIG